MAKISLNDSEILDTILVVEQLVPGLSLAPVKTMLKDLSLKGSNIIVNKKLGTSTFTLDINVS